MKITAWMMTVVLLVCGIAASAFADGSKASDPTGQAQFVNAPAVVNDICTVKYRFRNTDRKDIDVTTLKAGDSCLLFVQIHNPKKLPDQGVFYYNLPAEVNGAAGGENDTMTWSYIESTNQLAFSWKGKKPTDDAVSAYISVTVGGVYPLYNMAVIKVNGTEYWYRLDKTAIKANAPYTALGKGVVVTNAEATPYDFSSTTVTFNGKEYVYLGNDIEEYAKDPKPYYTVELKEIKTALTIGGLDKATNTFRWMLPEGVTAYDDDNQTGGYHRNYSITLHDAMEIQPLYNFLKGKDGKYYRLKKTTIVASPVKTYKSGTRMNDERYYIPEEYDFSDLVLTFDNKEYRYSSRVIKEGQYENYYTISKGDFLAKDKMHNDGNWYKNEAGWIDGSKATFTEEELKNNYTWGFHQDYVATFYNGNTTFYSVEFRNGDSTETIRAAKDSVVDLGTEVAAWNTAEDGSGETYDADHPLTLTGNITLYAQQAEENDEGLAIVITADVSPNTKIYAGTRITMTAELIGFENKNYTLQWQYSKDGQTWIDIPGANGITYTYNINAENAKYTWRAVANDITDKE